MGSEVETSATLPSGPPAREFAPGSTIGRFIVTERLGQGGMGVVVAARDPTLGRTVAIKLLRGAQQGPERLLREAQALARLSHENVVPVYEAGESDGEVYLVMELVRGQTLSAWASERHDWRDVVRTLLRAGRGLVAAHAAGLVHRDFKPDNVLVSASGRVQVSDFGLAITHGVPDARATTASELLDQRMTQAGSLVGTPAYMSPEQFDGHADARSDQFSFCATLYFALFGQLPFEGRDVPEYLAHVTDHEVRPPPPGRSVPGWLWQVIARGLDPDPDQRFPDMDALLAVLGRAEQRTITGPRVAALAVIIAVIAGGTWFVLRPAADACDRVVAGMNQIWNPAARDEVRASFAKAAPWSATLAATVIRDLDGRTQAWSARRIAVCRDHADGRASTLRATCLDEQLGELRTTTDVLKHGDGEVVRGALRTIAHLAPAQRCDDAAHLAALGPTSPTDAALATAVRALVRRSNVLTDVGRQRLALELADRAQAFAHSLDDLDLRAEIANARARALITLEPEKSTTYDAVVEGISLAGTAHDDELAVDGWVHMMDMCASHLWPSCDVSSRMAHAALTALGGDKEREALVLDVEAGLAAARGDGDFATAVTLRERALTLLKPGSFRAAVIEANLARVIAARGGDPEPHARHAIAAFVELGGPNDPDQRTAVEALAVAASEHNQFEDAEALFRRELALDETVYGANSLAAAGVHHNLGTLYEQRGDLPRALEEHHRALAVEEALDPGSGASAGTWMRIGFIEEKRHRLAVAIDAFTHALQLREKAFGLDDPIVGGTLHVLEPRLQDAHRWDDAAASGRRELALFERAEGPTGKDVADALDDLAFAQARGGAPPIDLIERELTIRETLGDAEPLALVQQTLAQLLWGRDHPGDRARALVLAQAADKALPDAERRALDHWLAQIGHAKK